MMARHWLSQAASLAGLGVMLLLSEVVADAQKSGYDFVDPLIGTRNGGELLVASFQRMREFVANPMSKGHVFAGASLPFGMLVEAPLSPSMP